MSETLELVLVGVVVGVAALYLLERATGVYERFSRPRRPDVPASRLVRKRPPPPPPG